MRHPSRFSAICYDRIRESEICNEAAENGRLDALEYLRTELHFNWQFDGVMLRAASHGHAHILNWAANRQPHLLSNADATLPLRKRLLASVCLNGHAHVLEWLLETHPNIFDEITIGDFSLSRHSIHTFSTYSPRISAPRKLSKYCSR